MAVRKLVLAGVFAALTGVAAQMSFVLPITGVPFTMQVFAVLLSGALLGPRWGAVAQGVYLLLGLVGVPVFARFSAGLPVLLGPTGGYLFSYPVAAFLVGLLANPEQRPALGRTAAAMAAGLAVIYAGGAGWAILMVGVAAGKVWAQWVLPFLAYDLFKVGVAAWLARRILAALGATGLSTGNTAGRRPA